MRILAKDEMNGSENNEELPKKDSNKTRTIDIHNINNEADMIAQTKSRFAQAVSSTVSALMSQRGYSRFRASSFILQWIRDKNDPPSDSKVIKFMQDHCIGFEDANRVLIVSEAIDTYCREHNVCFSQAVDNLTSRLKGLKCANVNTPSTFENEREMCDSKFKNSVDERSFSVGKSNSLKEIKKDLQLAPSSLRRKSLRKHTNNLTSCFPKYHKTKNSKKNSPNSSPKSQIQSANLSSGPYQSSYVAEGKHPSNEMSNSSHDGDLHLNSHKGELSLAITERKKMGKKPKLNSVNKVSTDSRNLPSKSIKNKPSSNSGAKRKRDRERSQHLSVSDPVNDDVPPSSKIRRSSTA